MKNQPLNMADYAASVCGFGKPAKPLKLTDEIVAPYISYDHATGAINVNAVGSFCRDELELLIEEAQIALAHDDERRERDR